MMININYHEITKRTLAATSEDFITGAISLDNFLIVVDSTLFPYTGKLFRDQIEKRFQMPVKFLFITHYHGDHLWGIDAFNDVSIVGSVLLIENSEKEKPIQPTRFREWKEKEPEKANLINEINTSFHPQITFTNGMKIHDGDLFVELKHCGGHTSCSSYAYYPQEKVLFAGDLIFAKQWPWAGDPTCNPDHWINALEEIMKLDIETVIPGHGPIVMKEEIEIYLNFLRELRKETIITLENNDGIEQIRIPPFYEDNTPESWVKKETLNFFYAFYKNKMI
jgi:cyclase